MTTRDTDSDLYSNHSNTSAGALTNTINKLNINRIPEEDDFSEDNDGGIVTASAADTGPMIVGNNPIITQTDGQMASSQGTQPGLPSLAQPGPNATVVAYQNTPNMITDVPMEQAQIIPMEPSVSLNRAGLDLHRNQRPRPDNSDNVSNTSSTRRPRDFDRDTNPRQQRFQRRESDSLVPDLSENESSDDDAELQALVGMENHRTRINSVEFFRERTVGNDLTDSKTLAEIRAQSANQVAEYEGLCWQREHLEEVIDHSDPAQAPDRILEMGILDAHINRVRQILQAYDHAAARLSTRNIRRRERITRAGALIEQSRRFLAAEAGRTTDLHPTSGGLGHTVWSKFLLVALLFRSLVGSSILHIEFVFSPNLF
jgi:hypothetical protein